MKRKMTGMACAAVTAAILITGCGGSTTSSTAVSGSTFSAPGSTADAGGTASVSSESASADSEGLAASSDASLMSNEEIIKKAAEDGKVGNWGLGNEYQVEALLEKYGEPTTYLTQAFDMDGFDDGSIELASAMTYNELGLVKNTYEGGYGYGDTVGTIDFNSEGVAMLEDNLFCKSDFAKANPNTVKAFIYATKKGWGDACANPDEAAQIVFKYGSSVSADHQKYMAENVADVCTHDFDGNKVSNLMSISDKDIQQTLDLSKKYIQLDDTSASSALQDLSIDDIRDSSYYEAALASGDGSFGTPEKTDITVQLCWLPQAEFMGYYVALDKGYYLDEGLNVTLTAGGGDISEITVVNNGMADFGTTMASNMIAADAGGMKLLEVAQPFEKSAMVLVYKKADFQQ